MKERVRNSLLLLLLLAFSPFSPSASFPFFTLPSFHCPSVSAFYCSPSFSPSQLTPSIQFVPHLPTFAPFIFLLSIPSFSSLFIFFSPFFIHDSLFFSHLNLFLLHSTLISPAFFYLLPPSFFICISSISFLISFFFLFLFLQLFADSFLFSSLSPFSSTAQFIACSYFSFLFPFLSSSFPFTFLFPFLPLIFLFCAGKKGTF